jgi:hypothetical protein
LQKNQGPALVFYLVLENLVLRTIPEFDGIASEDCKLFWSTGVYEITNSKHQITNKSQIFTLWNPPEEGRQEAAFHRAGIQ